jgi:oligopeptide/dipeptide ABC transporter ATP-binding protein
MTFDVLHANGAIHPATHRPVVDAAGITVEFAGPRRGPKAAQFRALSGVDLQVFPGETVGLVGESGSGKSTLTRVILGLQPAVAGRLTVDGCEVAVNGRGYPRSLRSAVQVVFQDPFASLNPSMSVASLIGEGLVLHRGLRGAEVAAEVHALLEAVRLPSSFASRRPAELSGGQRQRIALARAIAVRPKLLLLDEPVSSLDATTRRDMVALLRDLRDSFRMAYLFVGHDLGLISEISTRTVVLYQGRVMEEGPSAEVLSRPAHPYTDDLVAAVPIADPDRQAERRRHRLAMQTSDVNVVPRGPINHQSGSKGCMYALRCRLATTACTDAVPDLRAVSPDTATRAACFFPLASATRQPSTRSSHTGSSHTGSSHITGERP